jgi:hypothetical protein
MSLDKIIQVIMVIIQMTTETHNCKTDLKRKLISESNMIVWTDL